jgi:DNA-binding MarR family transcriptional regulator
MDKVNKILSLTELKPTERLILLFISEHPEQCESNIPIAHNVGISLPTVVTGLKNLSDGKYIIVTYETDEHTSPVRKITLNL